MEKVRELIKGHSGNGNKQVLEEVLELLKTEDGLFSVSVRITNNFYMGSENGKTVAFLFTGRDYADEFVKEFKWIGVEMKSLEIHPQQRVAFFNDLYRSGFEAVIIDKNHESLSMSLFSIIEKPEQDSDVLVNPELMRAAATFYQAIARDRVIKPMQDLMCAELYKAKYLIPHADIRTVTPPILTDGKGKKFYPVFTDWVEFGKFDKRHRFQGTVVRFRDFKKYIADVDGIVLNPFGFGLKLDPEKLEKIEKENMTLKVVK